MNCRDWEQRLALYAGDDLPPAERIEVERHLGECAGCQLFLSGLRESLETLREAHLDQPGEAHYAAVRARVLASLEPRRRAWWIYGLAATAAAALVMLFALRPTQTPKLAPQFAIAQPPPALAAIPPTPSPQPPTPAMHRRRTPTPGPRPLTPVKRPLTRARRIRPLPTAAPAKPLVVKLLTDDPDVVIYWITETTGE